MPHDKSREVEVVQADRDAAATLAGWQIKPANRAAILAGELDDDRAVQAFARHRQPSDAPMPEEVEAVLAKLLAVESDSIGEGLASNRYRNPDGPEASTAVSRLTSELVGAREAALREAAAAVAAKYAFRGDIVETITALIDKEPDPRANLRGGGS
jgi:hypothetical protein